MKISQKQIKPRLAFVEFFEQVGHPSTELLAVFTASQTARIARAYLAAYLRERRARMRPDSEHKKAETSLRGWRNRLKSWEYYEKI